MAGVHNDRIEYGNNAVREQQAAYAAAGAKQNHALVRELWAVTGQSDPFHVQRIADRSGLPFKWLSMPPKINGERGVDKQSWSRKEDGFFTDSNVSKKVAAVIAIKRKRERDEEISVLTPEEVVGQLSPQEKEISNNMTPDEIKKALEWKSPEPVADYSLILYMNNGYKHLLENIKGLLSFDKVVYYNMRPPLGNFD